MDEKEIIDDRLLVTGLFNYVDLLNCVELRSLVAGLSNCVGLLNAVELRSLVTPPFLYRCHSCKPNSKPNPLGRPFHSARHSYGAATPPSPIHRADLSSEPASKPNPLGRPVLWASHHVTPPFLQARSSEPAYPMAPSPSSLL